MIFSLCDDKELDAVYSKYVLATLSEFINIAFFIDVGNDNNRASFSVIDIFYLAFILEQVHEFE